MLEIKRASVGDSSVASDLLAAQLAEHRIALDSDRVRAGLEGLLQSPSRGFVLLATIASDAIGLAVVPFTWTVEHGGLSAWLDELYVKPEHRDEGVGTRLLASVIEEARAAGCAALDLEVDRTHARVMNMYLRAGFHQHDRTRFVLTLLEE